MHILNHLYINNTQRQQRSKRKKKENVTILSEKALGLKVQETAMSPRCITDQLYLQNSVTVIVITPSPSSSSPSLSSSSSFLPPRVDEKS